MSEKSYDFIDESENESFDGVNLNSLMSGKNPEEGKDARPIGQVDNSENNPGLDKKDVRHSGKARNRKPRKTAQENDPVSTAGSRRIVAYVSDELFIAITLIAKKKHMSVNRLVSSLIEAEAERNINMESVRAFFKNGK